MSGAELARLEVDERAFERMMTRAKIFARVPGLKKEIQDKPEAICGIMLSLQAYGIEPNLLAINDAFHWIEGKAEPSARLYRALCYHYGYDLAPLVRERDRAVVRITSPKGDASDWEYNTEDAKASGRLDEWVEDWRQSASGKNYSVKWVMLRAGQPYGDQPAPEWAKKLWAEGRGRRFDAWWAYPKAMFYKSACRAAVDGKAAHILLGAGRWAVEDRFPERQDFVEGPTAPPAGLEKGTQPAEDRPAGGPVSPSSPPAGDSPEELF